MNDQNVTELISPEQISQKIDELAKQIAEDYLGKSIILLGVLRGGFIVLADLSRALWRAGMREITIDFVKVSSYDDDVSRHSHPHIDLDLSIDISDKHVLIIEDIADSGLTLNLLEDYLKASNPATLKTVAFLNKPSGRKVEVKLDYIGFEVDGWIEGYGLDGLRACPSVTVRK
jgi:hypoxanthine phosphoribosyltransferase